MDIQRSAKIAYLLSTCHRFSKEIFVKLIKKYENNDIACTKYYYSIKIILDKPNENSIIKNTPTKSFMLKNVDINFLNDSYVSDIECKILEQLNVLSDDEKKTIKTNYAVLLNMPDLHIPDFDYICNKTIYTLINLIIKYHNKYKFLFIPMILDYSQDIGLVHQCGLLIDLRNGLFLFYEPYLVFNKYSLDYAYPIKQYLEIYTDVLPKHFLYQGGIKFYTFKEYFSLSNGIQSIMLDKNNANQKFNQKFDQYMIDIKQYMPDLYDMIEVDIKTDDNPVNQTDKTIKILNTLECFNQFNPGETMIEKYEQYFSQMLELYYLYNSKTCVSISIIEMNKLFQYYEEFVNASVNIDEKLFLSNKLQEYHKQYDISEFPNKILMNDIYHFIQEVCPDIVKKIDDNINSNIICRNIT